MKINIKKYTNSDNASPKNSSNWASSIYSILNKDIQLFGNQWKTKKKETLYSELSVLLGAGMDIKTALDTIQENQIQNADKILIGKIKTKIISGLSLSQAMENTNRFSLYEVYSIRIAEEGGDLNKILNELKVYFQKNIQYRRLLYGALSYPILVILVSFLALVFLLNFLVPIFGDIYKRLDQELPTMTKWVVKISEYFQNLFPFLLSALLLLVLIIYWQRKKNWMRNLLSKTLLHFPIFGSLIKKIYLSRFSQSLSFLLGANVPFIKALDLTQKMVNFYPIESALKKIKQEIYQGKPFHETLHKFDIFPKRMIALIKVGEDTNQLDFMLNRISQQYNEEVEQKTKILGSLIEPILIVFLAIIVGFILVAMYLPIFKLVSNFGV